MDPQQSHRRRLSTLIFSSSQQSQLDGSLSPNSRGGGASGAAGAESPSSSPSQNRTLKPPSTPTNNTNRNSFGFWGGSKSAASTPNLGNSIRTNDHANEFTISSSITASSPTSPSESIALTQAQAHSQGSGVGSAASMESHTSFQQRRKRSESTGGLKNTAGNISRIVKKGSSNFLRKFVKSFDDKDAPPMPNSSSISSHPQPPFPHQATRTVTAPQLQTLSSTTRGDTHIGPLDTPPPLSPLLGQELENQFSSMGTPFSSNTAQEQRQLQQHQHHVPQGSNHVESWLMNSSTSQPPISGAFSPDDLTTSLTMLSQEHSPLNRYPLRGTTSCISDDNALLDDDGDNDYDEDLDEDEDEDMPANISNRLSKLYESGSIQMNQSQTSLYYSTKSTLSEAEAAEIASRRTSLAQDALGYSLGLSRGNSIQFSRYSIGSMHSLQLAPLQPFSGPGSGTGSTPSSPGLARSLPENLETRPLPQRPVSLFIPPTTSAVVEDDEKTVDVDDMDRQEKATMKLEQKAVATQVEAASPAPSSASTLRPYSGVSGPGSMRPITICVGPEDANKVAITAGTTAATSLLTSDMTPTDQREATEMLALRTAKRCFDEDESFLKRDEIAEYMGTPKSFNRLVLGQYMNHFDFSGKRLDIAFRALCQKLVLKGETQEVDRILEAFADRYVRCNPRTLLGGADQAKDVVHAITYSVLLLNTDLHVVQQSSKMSRSAFVKNTLRVVQAQAGGETGSDEQQVKYNAQQRRYHGSVDHDSSATLMTMTMLDPLELPYPRSFTGESTLDVGVPSTGTEPKRRTPSVKSWKSGHSHQSTGFSLSLGNHNNSGSQPSHGNHNSNSKMGLDPKANGGYGNGKWWHQELESLLKDIYTAVKQHQILLPVSPATMRTSRSKSNASLVSPPTSPTASSFGSSLFSSNRMSRLIHPLSSSSSSSSQQLESNSGVLGGSTGAFGLGLSGRRNSVSARSKQLRNEAIQRLNAQAQAQAHGQTQHDTNYLTAPASSSFSPLHTNPRYSIAGSIFNEAIILDQHRGPTSSKDLSFLQAAGNQSQHSSSSRLSSLTSQISMSASAISTSRTTPSASQNSLASLQEDPMYKMQLLNPTSPNHLDASQFQQGSTLQPDAQAFKDQLHQQHIQSRYRIEGILWRKHLLERTDKKAQHRAWRQLLVVLDHEQGSLSMFRSDGTLPQIQTPPQAHRQQQYPLNSVSSISSTSSPAACIIENDSSMPLYDEIPLQHTITNILPAPGYSDTRKYVFALQLYTGAVYLFQAQTPEDCEAWTRSCNYWAAKTSKEPLVGGVVNMEYGWGRALDMVTLSTTQEEDSQMSPICTPGSITSEMVESSLTLNSNGSTSNIRLNSMNQATTDYLNYPPPPSSASSGTRSGYFGGGDSSHRGRSASIKSGTRGSTSSGSGGIGGGAGLSSGSGNIPLGDRVTLFEWTAPMPTMTRSLLSEGEQMQSLRRYVTGLGSDMDTHQEHRGPMARLFLPKSNNYAKAFSNWEKRSKHLLKEIIKWQIYVECLEQSQVHFQLLLQQFDFDCPADDADQTHPFENQQQTQQQQGNSQGYEKDDIEAELERLVVHEGLRSVII